MARPKKDKKINCRAREGFMRNLVILGSTGSIGRNALEVVDHLKDELKVIGLAVKSNIDLLEQQAHRFSPEWIAVYDLDQAAVLQKRLPHIPVLGGMEGLCELVALSQVDGVISALSGAAGILPTIAAIEAGKTIGLANKEALVAAGEYIIPLAKQKGVTLIPIDSEHNAIFQCLHRESSSSISRIILTSSGGPFRNWNEDQFAQISVDLALKHPNFAMGPKITIDSSTMMNKGLELIEAYWLFGLLPHQIEVLIHPQQKIHGFVEFTDGSILAQMCEPDMRVPIQYAMTFPKRYPGLLKPFNFVSEAHWDFYPPRRKVFRCLDLAYQALAEGGTLPCFMNAANEVLVHRFLNKEIAWVDIGRKLEALMVRHDRKDARILSEILEADALAREMASSG